jgi:hypothetical protein
MEDVKYTRLKIILIRLFADQNAGLHKWLEHLREQVLLNVSCSG